ncbi:TlpA family protein disulfide reductase [Mucilaginibacter sp. X4EP1]|uniref:TlpA family protein disulfide reductase n=1 Tax=Mucilaginibacter sp. X4EP1 TaxID=2723092 RepID=UPI002168D722|nr:TlpA disulfide reductase family protein [Mucilaginibacter sp. X4EP1]MCS3815142.1 peroxiredoxin [Mucilaginibacter sp. X4EP1]
MKKFILLLCTISFSIATADAQNISVYSFVLPDEGIVINSTAPDIILPDVNGNKIDINKSDYKYLLVNFWASWSKTSRKANPYFIKSFNQFQTKGFKIVSVSLDSDTNLWQQAIKEDGTSAFFQLNDRDGMKSAYLKDFEVDFIPANFLIDNNGKIIAKNLRKDELYKLLATLLPN